ncbi:MAG TPA: NAD(P)H-hydrate dehydratase, partial [Candidatus Lokiarchaeia archaeon]|nr:NAD(P)H-hydrate dehydratase [Candidatus Lokiarchaeia archaeon]
RSVECIIINDSSEIASLQFELQEEDLLIDALLGTGVRGKVREPYCSAISCFNQLVGFKVAVDLPSGMNPDTGEASDPTIRADLCVTFHRPKLGLQGGSEYIKELVVSEIGIPPEAESYVGAGDLQAALLRRDKFTHKGLNGCVLVVGGSNNYAGAPSLVALGAQTLGVDLIRIAAPEVVASTIRGYSPNLIVTPLPGDHLGEEHMTTLAPLVDWANAIVVGPGLSTAEGVGEGVVALLDLLITAGKPFVLDADALKQAHGHLPQGTEIPGVMTPHAGEFLALTGIGLPPPVNLEERKLMVKEQAEALGCVILLKGPTDIIASPSDLKLNCTGVPPMSVGGTGDVLAGLVGAFLSQHVDPFRAACAGAFLNGLYGQEAVKSKGEYITATDLVQFGPNVLKRWT